MCFLRYYEAVTTQLTYDKDPDIRQTSWPKAAGNKLPTGSTRQARRVRNPVRGSSDRAHINITQSPRGSTMTLSRALRKSCVLATPGVDFTKGFKTWYKFSTEIRFMHTPIIVLFIAHEFITGMF